MCQHVNLFILLKFSVFRQLDDTFYSLIIANPQPLFPKILLLYKFSYSLLEFWIDLQFILYTVVPLISTFFKIKKFYLLILEREEGRERERETLICCSTYMHLLVDLECAPTGTGTCNLFIEGLRRCNHLSC